MAQFWQTHDLADFEDELEGVTEIVFAREQADLWDEQIERDAEAGRFNALLEQADKESEVGLCIWSCTR